MDRLIGIIEKWPNAFGQAVFILIVLGMAAYSVNYLLYCVTCLLQRREAKPPVHR